MKLMSASCTAAVLLGISALIHPITSFALPSCGICDQWWHECQKDRKSTACLSWARYCRACPAPRSTDIGTPPSGYDGRSDTAWVDLRRAAPSNSAAE
jgi:hypothetical protein